jgi:hypothetical protein
MLAKFSLQLSCFFTHRTTLVAELKKSLLKAPLVSHPTTSAPVPWNLLPLPDIATH